MPTSHDTNPPQHPLQPASKSAPAPKRPEQDDLDSPSVSAPPTVWPWKTRAAIWSVLSLIALMWVASNLRHEVTAPADTFVAGAGKNFPSPLPALAAGKTGDTSISTTSTSGLLVHVAGRVRKPGVYRLPAGARVQDALKKAGGPLPDADANQLNLAAYAEDGTRLEVPLREERIRSEPATVPLISTPTTVSPRKTKTSVREAQRVRSNSTVLSSAPEKTQKLAKPVDINRATIDELQILPGIGPAIAQRILDYRVENGAFRSIDDLDNVKGIGEKKLAKLRPYILIR